MQVDQGMAIADEDKPLAPVAADQIPQVPGTPGGRGDGAALKAQGGHPAGVAVVFVEAQGHALGVEIPCQLGGPVGLLVAVAGPVHQHQVFGHGLAGAPDGGEQPGAGGGGGRAGQEIEGAPFGGPQAAQQAGGLAQGVAPLARHRQELTGKHLLLAQLLPGADARQLLAAGAPHGQPHGAHEQHDQTVDEGVDPEEPGRPGEQYFPVADKADRAQQLWRVGLRCGCGLNLCRLDWHLRLLAIKCAGQPRPPDPKGDQRDQAQQPKPPAPDLTFSGPARAALVPHFLDRGRRPGHRHFAG